MTASVRRRAGGSARAGRQWKSGRCLRIGVVIDGTIVQERLMSPGAKVTIGSDPSCTVVLHGGPRKHTLLESRTGGGGRLLARDGMRGKVSAAGGIDAFSGKAVRRLGPLDKGKIRLGDATVLFQFVRTPPTPAARRRTRFGAWNWSAVDWIFMAVILLSGLVHTAAFVWVNSKPPPTTAAMREVVDHFVTLAAESKTPPEVAEAEPDGEGPEVADEDPEPDPEPEPEPESEPATDDGGDGAADAEPAPIETPEERRARLLSEVEGLGVLGTTLDKPGTRYADLLADAGNIDGDVRDAVLASADRGLARPDEDVGLRSGGGDDSVVGAGELKKAGGGDGGTVEKESVVVITTDPGDDWTPPPTPGTSYDVPGQLKRYMGRFKGCYEKVIKDGAEIEGKLVLSWTIEIDGSVADVHVESDSTGSDELRSCVVRGLRRAVLGVPPDIIDVEAYPLVFSRQ